MIDRTRWKNDRRLKYLHDRRREDRQQINPSERFYITYKSNPEKSMILRSRSIRELRTQANYLSVIWEGVANPISQVLDA